jgi:hypothetical protein
MDNLSKNDFVQDDAQGAWNLDERNNERGRAQTRQEFASTIPENKKEEEEISGFQRPVKLGIRQPKFQPDKKGKIARAACTTDDFDKIQKPTDPEYGFATKFKDKKGKTNMKVHRECKIDDTGARVKWIKDGKEIMPSDQK